MSSVAASGTGITAGTGDLATGSVVTLTVNLSEAVTVAGGTPTLTDRESGVEGKRGDLGGRRIIKKKKGGAGPDRAEPAGDAGKPQLGDRQGRRRQCSLSSRRGHTRGCGDWS